MNVNIPKKSTSWGSIAGLIISGFLVISTLILLFAPDPITPEIKNKVTVPQGYTFLDASNYGRASGQFVWYCREYGTSKIFICTDGVIGKELIFPDGYEFLGAASGESPSSTVYYCKNKETQEVYTCIPVKK